MASKQFAKMLDDRCHLSKAIWIWLQDQLKRVLTKSWVFESSLLLEPRVAHLCFFQRSKKTGGKNKLLLVPSSGLFINEAREVVLDILVV